MKKNNNSPKTVDVTIVRLKEKLASFFISLPSSPEEQNKFAKDIIEFYAHEIIKFKISILAELEKDAMAEIEALPTKKQNNFYKERIKEKLEETTEIDYQPEVPRLPECKSEAAKFMPGALIGGGCGLAWLAISGGGAGIGKILMVLFLSAAGGVASNNIVTSVERNSIQKIIQQFLDQEREQLVDFSNRLSDRYIRSFEDFLSKE